MEDVNVFDPFVHPHLKKAKVQLGGNAVHYLCFKCCQRNDSSLKSYVTFAIVHGAGTDWEGWKDYYNLCQDCYFQQFRKFIDEGIRFLC